MTWLHRAAVGSALALTACAQVLGLDEYADPPATDASEPTLSWTYRFAGDGSRFPSGVGVAPSGDVFVTGHANGTFESLPTQQEDIFAARFTATGSLADSALLSSTGQQFASGIEVNSDNQVFISGQYMDEAFRVSAVPSPIDLQNAGAADGFILRLDVELDVNQAFGFSGAGDDAMWDLASDPSGVYLAGFFHSDLGIAGQNLVGGAGADGVVACLFGCQWADGFDGGGNQYLWGVDVAGGTVVAVGGTEGDAFAGLSQDCVGAGGSDLMVTAWDTAAGQRQWSQCYGDSADQEAFAVLGRADGTSVIAGKFSGSLDLGSSELSAADTDAVVFELDVDGTVSWATAIGGVGTQQATDLAEDDDGDIWVVGYTSGALQVDGTSYPFLGGANDGFVVRVSSGGRVEWAGVVGGAGADRLNAVGVALDGTVVATGSVQGDVTVLGEEDIVMGGGSNDALVFGIDPANAR